MLVTEFGLIHYNFQGTLEEFLDYAQETGFQCMELPVSDMWRFREDESFEEGRARARVVRQMLEERGLRASSITAQNDFCQPDQSLVDAQVERMKNVAELARIVGTDLLRIDGGWPKDGVDPSQYMDLIVGALNQLKGFMESEGFRMALDNHGLVTNDARFQLEVIRRVGSKSLGANVDTMNYRWAGHDLDTVRGFYDMIAPHVFHTHFKDGRGSRKEYVGLALGEGEVPLAHAVQAFKAAGYQGPWVVEYEGKTCSRTGYKKGLEWLRAHV